MIRYFYILLIASTFFSGQSCTRILYSPNTVNVPLLQEKNEFQALVSFNNFQSAFAVSDKIGIMLNGQVNSCRSIYELNEDFTTHRNLIEGGIGYYTAKQDNSVFEVFTGWGIGNISFGNRQNNLMDSYSAKMSKFFIQPSYGINSKHVDFAFSLRLVNLNYFDEDLSNYAYNPTQFENDIDLSTIDDHHYFLAEPSAMVRFGLENVKFQIQVIRVIKITQHPLEVKKGIMNFSMHIKLAPRLDDKVNNKTVY